MASFAQDIMSYKYYMVDVYSEETSAIEKFLHSEKKRSPTRIPLVFLIYKNNKNLGEYF